MHTTFFTLVWVVVSIFHLDQNKQHGVLQNRPLTTCVQYDAFWFWPTFDITDFRFQKCNLELLFRSFKLPICFCFLTNNAMKSRYIPHQKTDINDKSRSTSSLPLYQVWAHSFLLNWFDICLVSLTWLFFFSPLTEVQSTFYRVIIVTLLSMISQTINLFLSVKLKTHEHNESVAIHIWSNFTVNNYVW